MPISIEYDEPTTFVGQIPVLGLAYLFMTRADDWSSGPRVRDRRAGPPVVQVVPEWEGELEFVDGELGVGYVFVSARGREGRFSGRGTSQFA